VDEEENPFDKDWESFPPDELADHCGVSDLFYWRRYEQVEVDNPWTRLGPKQKVRGGDAPVVVMMRRRRRKIRKVIMMTMTVVMMMNHCGVSDLFYWRRYEQVEVDNPWTRLGPKQKVRG
jgi:hypothetical protein